MRYRTLILAIVATVIAASAPPARAAATTFIVTSTANSGAGTLRQAIIDANANANPTEIDRIDFAIAGNGPHTIAPTTALATIIEPVAIDGYTQGDATPGVPADDARPNDETFGSSNAVLKIVLDGTGAGSGSGFAVSSDDVTIRGLVVNDFPAFAVNATGERTTIAGNFIGTDAAGTTGDGNNLGGIGLGCVGSDDSTIGGPDPADRNIVAASGGSSGAISLGSTGCKRISIQNNIVGVAANGTTDLGNSGNGILLRTTLNGKMQVLDNVVANSTGDGVALVFGGDGVTMLGNRVFANDEQGIDFDDNGVTANDGKDKDNGTNDLQNFPEITTADTDAGITTVTGTLKSTPRTRYIIEVFTSIDPDPSGNGEGQLPLGSVKVKTNTKGKASFQLVAPNPPAGHDFVSATATDRSTGNTSEFSLTVVLT